VENIISADREAKEFLISSGKLDNRRIKRGEFSIKTCRKLVGVTARIPGKHQQWQGEFLTSSGKLDNCTIKRGEFSIKNVSKACWCHRAHPRQTPTLAGTKLN
jgi:hypothetical protein